ncbi:nitric oxide-associated protein 1 isoform X1 [Phascolarctos cinereus]|uniref:Nitric oxide-associated protein 1 isoform X1 n=1 Tax=Phascolarctos cinereus TaxID=38626 RepID=A0A6P5J9L5_PHACI|nr:nitric oxide-associated protein 1 isoform X1 [Phascolarctos cinereus]
MLPQSLSRRLLLQLRRRAAPLAARHGSPALWLSPGLPAASAFSPVRLQQSQEARGGRGALAVGTMVDPRRLEESFVFPEYVPEPELEPSVSAELQRRQEEEEREQLLRDERRLAQQQRKTREKRQHPLVGSPDPTVPASGVNCSGCGAELHCQDPFLPGYLPSEKYRSLEAQPEAGGLARAVCQRCWLLLHHQRALRVRVNREQYRELVHAALRRPGPALVLYLVDVLDLPDPLLPDLPDLLGPRQLVVLGNKVDLLPGDSPGYLGRLRERLWDECARAGLQPAPRKAKRRSAGAGAGAQEGVPESKPAQPGCLVQDVLLISAKTGYGVEDMISALQRSWRYRGDVYLVGSTNAGKSTLFNTLLQSDYCIAKGADAIDRATISTWPGTTLNLLKFPISNPTPYRMFERNRRLKEEATKSEDDLNEQEQKHLNQMKKQAYLVGRVGRTFCSPKNDETTFEFDADSLAFDMENEPQRITHDAAPARRVELTPQEVKDAHWFYDTPGIVKENCVLNYLTEKEVKIVLPAHSIVPRTFILKPGMVLFLGALGRLDYLQGNTSVWFSVVASNLLSIHITALEKADTIYQKHAGQALLQVPMGGVERMAEFPPLVSQDITLEGIGKLEAVADIKFSTAGWVAITSLSEDRLHLRGYTPQGTTLTIRQPPLLPHIVDVKGERIKKSVAYKTKKPLSLVDRLKSSRKRK